MLSKPVLGQLDQGTIFSCGLAEDYPGCRTHGLVITARCDIAQQKAPVFNYLPIVSVDDWIHRDGRLVLCDRLLKNVIGNMRKLLESAGHSPTVLDTEDPAMILDKLFPADDKPQKRSREQFDKLVKQKTLIECCEGSNPSDQSVVELGELHRGDTAALIKELTSQRLNGYYFLASATHGGDDLGYVVLLREVRHIPRALAASIGRGLARDEYDAACKRHSDYAGRLAFPPEEFAMPVGQIVSPHIEHLMQSFSVLFSRIGLPVIGREYVDGLWQKQPSVDRRQK